MTTQDEVRWLIDTVRQRWPDRAFEYPDDLALRNRDEPVTYVPDQNNPDPDAPAGYASVRELASSTDSYVTVSVSMGSQSRETYGTRPQNRVDTVLDVRVEGKSEWENGAVADVQAFDRYVTAVKYTVETVLSYPDVPAGDYAVDRIVYLDAAIEDENDESSAYKDAFQHFFSVRLRGNRQTATGNTDTRFPVILEGPFIG